jgi:TPR repeat protein
MNGHDVNITDKHSLILDYKSDRPEEYKALQALINKDIVSNIVSDTSQDITFVFPEKYIDWLVYNSKPEYNSIGLSLKNSDCTISLDRTEILEEYVIGKALAKAKRYLNSECSINKVTLVGPEFENAKISELLSTLKEGVTYYRFSYKGIQYVLGQACEQGVAAKKDCAEALKYYMLAAEDGNTDAMLRLGYIYTYGRGGVDKDYAKAFAWFKKSAENGNDDACRQMLHWYYNLKRGTINKQLAIECLEKNPDRLNWEYLARLYDDNDPQVHNDNKAFIYYKKEADWSTISPDAEYHVGKMLLEGRGTEKNEQEAAIYLQKAARRIKDAAILAGDLATRGFTVTSEPNKTVALRFYDKGGVQGYIKALQYLQSLENGLCRR